jgi:hypothetical protein
VAKILVDQPTQVGVVGRHKSGFIDEDGLGLDSVGCCCSSCVGGLGFCMVLYMGCLYIRLAQKYALTKCGLDDIPVLYLTLIAI